MTLLIVDGVEGDLVRLEHPDGSMLVLPRSWLPGTVEEVRAYALRLGDDGSLHFTPRPQAARAAEAAAGLRMEQISEVPPDDFTL